MSRKIVSIIDNNEGSSLIVIALALPMLLAVLALGIDYAVVVKSKNEIGYLGKIACNQMISSNYTSSYKNRRKEDTERNFYSIANNDRVIKQSNITISLTDNDTKVNITTRANVNTYFARIFGATAVPVDAINRCNISDPITTSGFAFCEGFENPKITKSQGWDFYKSLPGWSRYFGNNLELQNINSGGAAAEGQQYTELDSDGNSGMERTFTLPSADMEISFMYRSETWNSSNANTHGIAVCLERTTSPRCTNKMVELKQITDWQRVSKDFRVVEPGAYRLSIFATGDSDHTGGQVDAFRITQAGAPPAAC